MLSIAQRRDASVASLQRAVQQLRLLIPRGKPLPHESWRQRNRAVLILLWIHVVGLLAYGLLSGYQVVHLLAEISLIAVTAVVAGLRFGSQQFRGTVASVGLVTSSAMLVHLSGGFVEMHFHFFVMLAIIALYEDWAPFLVAIAFVLLHHGVFGVLDPTAIYNHPDAWAQPWKWVLIHAGFVLAASLATIVFWRLNENARQATKVREAQNLELVRQLYQDIADRQRTEAALRERTREVAQRTLSLEALYRADEELHRSLRLDDVLDALVDVAAQVLGADKSAVHTWDAKQERLVVAATRGISAETIPLMTYEPGEGVVGGVALARESIVLADVQEASERQAEVREGIRSSLGVPIVIGGDLFGVFTVGYIQRRTFDLSDDRLLQALAQRAALAIENARLYEQTKETAVLEERQRLARDLHDAVTQTLFSASLIADVVPRLWERNPDEGERRLAELRQLTRGALAEMRTLLLELRPKALTDAHLGDLLRQLADAFAGRAGVPIDVEVDGTQPLAPEVQVALFRIAQEALGNVVKHANATRIQVGLTAAPERVELRVRDNGRGFDPEAPPNGHLGTAGMHERAASIGARLDLHSVIGEGTAITVTWREHP